MLKMDPMKEALMRKKAKGLDLTIILKQPEGEGKKGGDLAPENPEFEGEKLGAEKAQEEEAAEDMNLEGEPEELAGLGAEEGDDEEAKGADMEALKEAMMAKVSSADEEAMMSGERKPKSLGERARMALMSKFKK